MPKLSNNNKKLYDVIKSGSMTKRSQNKKRFTPVNYKNRWFELTNNLLSYFDIENVEVSFFFFIIIYFISLLFTIYIIALYVYDSTNIQLHTINPSLCTCVMYD